MFVTIVTLRPYSVKVKLKIDCTITPLTEWFRFNLRGVAANVLFRGVWGA